jgi:uncharacterized protein
MYSSLFIGVVRDVDGPTISVALDPNVPPGLIFVGGEPYQVGQVGSFARIPMGYADLVGVVTRVGAGAAPVSAEPPAIESRWLTLEVVGEAAQGKEFARGVAQLPSVGDQVHVVTGSDLSRIYGTGGSDLRFVDVGHVAAAESIAARVDINQLVTRHSAVVGSTGSGKSTTVASLLQSISNADQFPSARAILFDLHGEYARALGESANVFTLNTDAVVGSLRLNVPFWGLTFDELSILMFGSASFDDAGRAFVRDEVVRLKRESFAEVASSGLQVQDITADSPVPFSLRTLWFDLHVLLNATHTGSGDQSRASWALKLDSAGNPIQPGNAEDLVAPIFRTHTQAAGAEKVYLSTTPVNIRRQVDILGSRLRDRRFDFLFDPDDWAPNSKGVPQKDLGQLLQLWVGLDRNVTVVDLSGVPPTVIKDVVGSMTRLIYDAMFWARKLSEGTRERPLLFVFEEAHSYLQAASDMSAKSAVQRIVREGRKYGMGAMVVSQRPSEIDPTILSQCGTIVAMRLTNATDRQHVLSAAADNLQGILSMLPVLRTGEAIIVGESVPMPMRTIIRLPTSPPDSQDPRVVGVGLPGGWDRAREPSNYEDVVLAWRSQNQNSTRIVISEQEVEK